VRRWMTHTIDRPETEESGGEGQTEV
jgi:hypothetical protein